LTFRIARSLDTWLHAADFPGSHVVIHNPNRKPIPDRTLLEAAQLAAFYSNARKLGKAAVNYTQKKYVNKPRRAAPGLVSLASFKTILVEPVVPFEPQDN
jgi:predicted ribosome quality control (RQC) complex YloA/Tae2 family protein